MHRFRLGTLPVIIVLNAAKLGRGVDHVVEIPLMGCQLLIVQGSATVHCNRLHPTVLRDYRFFSTGFWEAT